MLRAVLTAWLCVLTVAACIGNEPVATLSPSPTEPPSAQVVPGPVAPAASSLTALRSPTPVAVARVTSTPTGSATMPPSPSPHPSPEATSTQPSPTATLVATSAPPSPTPTLVATTAAPAPAPTLAATATPVAQPKSAAASQPVTSIGLQLVVEGLTAPVALVVPPDDSGRLSVVDQIGLVRIIDSGGRLLPSPFLDLRQRMVQLRAGYDERGLLGLAFHPDYASNGRLFVYYGAPLRSGAPSGWNHTNHVSEFRVSSGDPNLAEMGSERILAQIDQPQTNHEGGTLAFGPDGYLYLSLGDGGGANDQGIGHASATGNGQSVDTVLGSILRIDVDSGDPYGIPADNPFAGGGGAGEIYAYGFRNPYRFSFDVGADHALYVADVGQNRFEEVSVVTRGGNYGWRVREGTHCFDPQTPGSPPAECPSTGTRGEPLVPPVIEYDHRDVGLAVVGGYVYRGNGVPQLQGQYVFGDWSTSFGQPDGTLLVSTPQDRGSVWPIRKLEISGRPGGELGHFLLGFGQDRNGEIYVLVSGAPGPSGSTGKVYRLVPAS